MRNIWGQDIEVDPHDAYKADVEDTMTKAAEEKAQAIQTVIQAHSEFYQACMAIANMPLEAMAEWHNHGKLGEVESHKTMALLRAAIPLKEEVQRCQAMLAKEN